MSRSEGIYAIIVYDPMLRGIRMAYQSLIGVLGLGLILGLIASQVAKITEDRRKKVPVRIDDNKKKRS